MGQDLGKTSRLLSIRRKGGRRGFEPKNDLMSSSDHNSDESSIHFGVRVEGIDELMSNTKFSRQELQRMYRGFKNIQVYMQIMCSTCSTKTKMEKFHLRTS